MPLLTTVLDWCFPPRAEELTVRNLSESDLTPTPYYPNQYTTCLLPFSHSSIQALVHEAKFFYNQAAHRLLGTIVYEYTQEHYPAAYLIPIPLHRKRERERGFNQVTAVLHSQATLKQQCLTNVLQRHTATQPQTSLSAAERNVNVQGVFTVHKQKLQNISATTPLLLVDDVYTTGATLESAYQTMRAACPNPIYCLTFAYA